MSGLSNTSVRLSTKPLLIRSDSEKFEALKLPYFDGFVDEIKDDKEHFCFLRTARKDL